ncbi:cation:proton antiporter [Bacillus marinisedimentorum]|uniref:cation:proton antiporter n=1 Tax=Bacillus marinisedimentorum TaxID=1821260 RepID=UPI0008721B05|nr:sodium:proton antiporter [Bacillus marinisedimentorum]
MESTQLFVLLLAGFIIQAIDKKKKRFPIPIVLVFLGIALSPYTLFSEIRLTHDLIFDWFLPALLFVSAYRYPIKKMKKYAMVITSLGTIGIFLTVGLLGILMFFLIDPIIPLSVTGFFLIAALLTPTDPVSVVSILEESASTSSIPDVVEGESLLNDGTSIVLFAVILDYYLDDTPFSIWSFLYDFAYVGLGGIAAGIVLGHIAKLAFQWIHQRELQIILSIILAYFSFYIAEYIHASGVLATVAAGMYLSKSLFESEKNEEFRSHLDGFWGVIEPMILWLVFLLMGIQSTKYVFAGLWMEMFAIFLLSIAARFIVVTAIIKLIPAWNGLFSWREIAVINWSGIKGTMSIALLLGLAITESREFGVIVPLTFGTILISLVLQSMTVYPVSKWLLKPKKQPET